LASLSFAHVFAGPHHEPFYQPAASADAPGALLVHGYPGTPDDMRPIASIVAEAGWGVSVILLPGFGTQIDQLPSKRHAEWLSAVHNALAEMRQRHNHVALVGYSMGGALSLITATSHKPDALVLLAPFQQIDHPLWRVLPILKRVMPTFRPLRLMRADLETPAGQQAFVQQAGVWLPPDINLADPHTRQAVLNFRLPVAMFDEVRQVGLLAHKKASQLAVPTLLIQGDADGLVLPKHTDQLAARIPNVIYKVIAGWDHLIPREHTPAWFAIRKVLLPFLAGQAEIEQ
jgi:carboxylesterase